MNVSAGRGGICLPALLSKSHHDSVLGVGCGSRAKTLTDMDNALRNTHTYHDKPREVHILLAVVVHSVPTSSFTVFIISITVKALGHRSLNHCLPSPRWTGLRPFSFTLVSPMFASIASSIKCLNSHSSPEVAAKHSHPRAFQPCLPFNPMDLWELPGVTVNCPVNNRRVAVKATETI